MVFFLRKYKFFFSSVFLGLVFFTLGLGINRWYLKPQAEKKAEITENKTYPLINSDFNKGEKQIIDKKEYISLKNDLLSFFDEQKSKGEVSDLAVYFRDLKDGPIMGIDELDEFAPASLLKLPIAFVFFNEEENQSGFLENKIILKDFGQGDYVPYFPSAVSPKENEPISIETLLRYMITYSDNVSYQALVKYLNEIPGGSEKILQTFQEIGIVDPQNSSENTLNVRGYASLFRLLYNVSFLNKNNSEKILSWLAQSDFTAGLAAGVPDGILVAHKFGERELENSDSKQLHDCGIVYYPENPYLLCVMTRGKDMNNLSEIIKSISSMVYKEVDSRRIVGGGE